MISKKKSKNVQLSFNFPQKNVEIKKVLEPKWRKTFFFKTPYGYGTTVQSGTVEHKVYLNWNSRKELVLKVDGSIWCVLQENAQIKGYEGITKERLFQFVPKSPVGNSKIAGLLLSRSILPEDLEGRKQFLEDRSAFIQQLELLKG